MTQTASQGGEPSDAFDLGGTISGCLRCFGRWLAVAGHVASDDRYIRLGGGGLVDEFSVEHHHDSIGKLEDFIQVFADQQNRRPAIAGLDDLGANLRRRREIQTEAGVGGDQHLDLLGQFTRQHRALHVAAGKVADRRFRRWCLHAIFEN